MGLEPVQCQLGGVDGVGGLLGWADHEGCAGPGVAAADDGVELDADALVAALPDVVGDVVLDGRHGGLGIAARELGPAVHVLEGAGQAGVDAGAGVDGAAALAVGDDDVVGAVERDHRHRLALLRRDLDGDERDRGDAAGEAARLRRGAPRAEGHADAVHAVLVDAVAAGDVGEQRVEELAVGADGQELPLAVEGVGGDDDHPALGAGPGQVAVGGGLEGVRARTVEVQDQRHGDLGVVVGRDGDPIGALDAASAVEGRRGVAEGLIAHEGDVGLEPAPLARRHLGRR